MLFIPKFLAQYRSQNNYKKEISLLSHDIEKRILESLDPINEKSAPKEIRPLIKAINRLIEYFEERSRHEQDFSANASHELRTPLAGIRLQTELAMSTDNPKIQMKAHQNVLKAIEHNERLIEQLLILARLTADRVELTMEKIDLAPVCKDVLANLENMAKAKQIYLDLVIYCNATIIGSKESLSILIHNLVRNSLSYIPDRGQVLIKLHSEQGKKILSVIDNGPGIPEQKYKIVMQRFQKLNNHNSGCGLGLAIVKRICDLHRASLTFERAAKTGGLKVNITF